MSPTTIWPSLLRELATKDGVRRFDVARARRAALADYVSIASVLEKLKTRSVEATLARDGLVRVLLDEYQAEPSSFWSAALALAFRPMIVGLVRQVEASLGDDTDGVVIAAFFETIRTLPTGKGAPLRLVLATRRRIFRPLRAERARQALTTYFDEASFFTRGDRAMEALIDMPRAESTAGTSNVTRLRTRRRVKARALRVVA